MNKRLDGSILIWSILLVVFISFSFLYISSGIKSGIEINKKNILNLQSSNSLENLGLSVKNYSFENNESLEVKYFLNYNYTLRQKEIINLSFLSNNTGSLNINNGGPLFYKVYTGTTIYSSGFVDYSQSDIVLPASYSMSLENLGGLAGFSLDFNSNTGVVYPSNYLTINKNIGGTNLMKSILKR
ncbi:MAG: hypothetical protein PHE25_01955 [Candidatus Gracilibacteria bacterium]|nr:hypothetical protein [Candidatus Gracilibacteria bacterium]